MAGTRIARARLRLWGVTFSVLSALSVVLVYVSTVDVAGLPSPSFLPSRSLLGFGLGGALVVFALYVIDAERKLRRLSDRLVAEQLAAERLAAEQAEQRDFVSMAAHELRAPLTAIKGFTRTLMTRFDQIGEARRTEYLVLVNEQSDRLARLIDDLMSVSRIDAGRVQLERAPTDVAQLALEVLARFRSHWAGRGIDVETDGPLPRALADPRRVEEVLVNLIDNAVKYSTDPVTVSVAARGGEVEVAVRDGGPGMTDDEVAGLFAKFHRLPQAIVTEVPGTGLGLYIVRGLVEAHGGRVWVRSRPGEGSTFGFTLPSVHGPAEPMPGRIARAS